MSDESQKFCELGAEHLERGEPEEALQWYERAIREDPQNPDAWGGRGKACYDLGQLERADRCFKRALRFLEEQLQNRPRPRGWWTDKTAQRYLRALHWRGLCRFWLGVYDDAARIFRKILKLAPSDPLDVRFLLGETYFRMGDLDLALQEFDRGGDDPDAFYNMGLAWFFKGDFVRSTNAFRRGIFENVYLAARLAGVEPPIQVPTYSGTHPRGLDSLDAALDYTDRCGDLWMGKPLLQQWLRGIYEHPIVQKDVAEHLQQVHVLSTQDLSPGERARMEGQNANLRSEPRLSRSDPSVAADVMRRLFHPPA
ncbi:MAG: tetratricopeptide repeat protein [Planctomycetota bacterium]|jgi:tetratricopeptide (TPR) repeat protein